MTWAVVPAAGVGSRFGAALPKQYMQVDGEALVAHALRALLLHPAVEGVVVALAEGDAHWPGWTELQGKPVVTCVGGESRADSVLAGLAALPASVRADDFVLVHDAARPNLSQADLQQLLERGRADPVGAILAAPVRDTLKLAGDDGGIDATQPRERLWRARGWVASMPPSSPASLSVSRTGAASNAPIGSAWPMAISRLRSTARRQGRAASCTSTNWSSLTVAGSACSAHSTESARSTPPWQV